MFIMLVTAAAKSTKTISNWAARTEVDRSRDTGLSDLFAFSEIRRCSSGETAQSGAV
jgi:hypothetical protein